MKKLLREKKIQFNGPYAKKIYPQSLKESLSENWIDWWVDKADYYNEMKHIQYYESFEHLIYLLNTANLLEISQNMKKHNQERKEKVYNFYKDVITKQLKK